jgi:uncharacterized membrane protein
MSETSFIHADIFFFISSIALVIISIGITIALIYLISILKNVKEISNKIKGEGTELIKDLRDLRIALRQEGMKWRYVADLIRHFFAPPENKEKARKAKKAKEGPVSSIFK